jgi:hypothetical protein
VKSARGYGYDHDVSVCYDLVLIEYPDGQWSIEPTGIDGVQPGSYLVSGANPTTLVERDAREIVARAANVDFYSFNMRFVSPEGEVLATSTMTSNPLGRHHRADTVHEDVFYSAAMRQRLWAPEYAMP